MPRWSRQHVTRTSVEAGEVVAVAARRPTVQAGLDVMSDGGNAVDAAVAMAFVAAVVEPTETSIGGSGFMLVDDPARRTPLSVEFGPRAPLAADPRLAGHTRPGASGPLLPCVPGLVAGLCLARDRLGRLPLARLVEPAIELAERGFEVDEYLCLQMLDNLAALRADAGCARAFLRGGLPPVPCFALRRDGEERPILRQPELAATLRAIAAGGARAFYRGELAGEIATGFAAAGGILTREDLARYRARIGSPRQGRYRDWRVLGPAAPCGAGAVLHALGALEAGGPPTAEPTSPGRLVRLALALRAAFADRTRSLAGRADEGHGTTHLCAVDRDGRLVTCTTTLGETFGSRFLVPGVGVLFDSGLAWFDAVGPNGIAPAKRPLVNMCPLLLRSPDGRRVGLGAAGGRRIISAVSQVAAALMDYALGLQEAIELPRLDASDAVLRVSDRVPSETRAALREAGHELELVIEQHAPHSYELARPAGAEVCADGSRSGGFAQFPEGYVAGE